MGVFDKASLALVPDGIKDGKLYSIKPTDGSGDFTFTRGSNLAATRVDENGLIEKGRENFVEFSNDFSTSKTPFNVTVSSGEAGYDGTNNAWKLIKGSSSGDYLRWIKSGGLGNVVFTYSIYVKAGSLSYFVIWTTGGNQAYFELTGNGSVTYTQGSNLVDSKIESVGNGWYRCSLTTYPEASEVRLYPTNDGTPGVAGGTSGDFVYIQNFQAEYGLVATEYIDKVDYVTGGLAGILENLPRIDYTGGTASLLLEPQRSNLVPFSEYLSGLSLSGNPPIITQNYAVSPEGVQNAVRVQDTDATNYKVIQTQFSITAGSTYTISVYVKKATSPISTYGGFYFDFDGGTRKTSNLIFDEYNGTLVNATGNAITSVIHPVIDEGDYWRFSATATDTGSNNLLRPTLRAGASANGTSLSLVTKDYTAYGFQCEEGSYPTSYIPTYGTSVTRNGDILDRGSNLAYTGNYTLFIEFELTKDAVYLLTNTALAYRLFIEKNDAYFKFGSSNVFFQNMFDWEANLGTNIKMAIYKNGTSSKMFVNGTEYTPSLNSLSTGDEVLDWRYLNYSTATDRQEQAYIKKLLEFEKALTDAECITLTT